MEELKRAIDAFVTERGWDQFHSPKNLVMALSVEAAELVEPFQWLSEEESCALPPETLEHVGEEIADVLIYLLRLCKQLDLDPIEQAHRKLEKNAIKYPADKVRGSARKYSEYD